LLELLGQAIELAKRQLQINDDVQISNANINVTVASLEGNTIVSDSVISVDPGAPYGQFFMGPDVTIAYNEIHADGDRYANLKPLDFAGPFQNNLIFVTITQLLPCPSGRSCHGFFDCTAQGQ